LRGDHDVTTATHDHCQSFRDEAGYVHPESTGTYASLNGTSTPPMCTSAWIDPIGKFYPVRDCGHMEFAEANFGTWDLESRGWVHLSFGNIIYDSLPRQAQVNTLYDVVDHYEEGAYAYADILRSNLYALLAVIDAG
jgi:hypothetical protein